MPIYVIIMHSFGYTHPTPVGYCLTEEDAKKYIANEKIELYSNGTVYTRSKYTYVELNELKRKDDEK